MFAVLSMDTALLGTGIVFVVIAVLVVGIFALRKASGARGGSPKEPQPDPVAPLAERVRMDARSTAGMVPAPGSIGEVDLYTVDDHTAALLMAIVAEDLACEPNELTFVSIREV